MEDLPPFLLEYVASKVRSGKDLRNLSAVRTRFRATLKPELRRRFLLPWRKDFVIPRLAWTLDTTQPSFPEENEGYEASYLGSVAKDGLLYVARTKERSLKRNIYLEHYQERGKINVMYLTVYRGERHVLHVLLPFVACDFHVTEGKVLFLETSLACSRIHSVDAKTGRVVASAPWATPLPLPKYLHRWGRRNVYVCAGRWETFSPNDSSGRTHFLMRARADLSPLLPEEPYGEEPAEVSLRWTYSPGGQHLIEKLRSSADACPLGPPARPASRTLSESYTVDVSGNVAVRDMCLSQDEKRLVVSCINVLEYEPPSPGPIVVFDCESLVQRYSYPVEISARWESWPGYGPYLLIPRHGPDCALTTFGRGLWYQQPLVREDRGGDFCVPRAIKMRSCGKILYRVVSDTAFFVTHQKPTAAEWHSMENAFFIDNQYPTAECPEICQLDLNSEDTRNLSWKNFEALDFNALDFNADPSTGTLYLVSKEGDIHVYRQI